MDKRPDEAELAAHMPSVASIETNKYVILSVRKYT